MVGDSFPVTLPVSNNVQPAKNYIPTSSSTRILRVSWLNTILGVHAKAATALFG
jgi:hypothetical protein